MYDLESHALLKPELIMKGDHMISNYLNFFCADNRMTSSISFYLAFYYDY